MSRDSLNFFIFNIAGIGFFLFIFFASKSKSYEQYFNEKTKKVLSIIKIPIILSLVFAIAIGDNSRSVAIFIIIDFIVAFISYILIKLLKKFKNDTINEENKIILTNNNKIIYFLVTILLPVICLLLNTATGNMFGDLNYIWFYIIAILNGVLFLIPDSGDKNYRLLLFYLKSVGLTYILYFSLIFMPVIPFGLLGIILFGLGLLTFTPFFILFLQTKRLLLEYKLLKQYFEKSKIILVFVLGLITLPAILPLTTIGDKTNLYNALNYVQNDSYSENINIPRLNKTLKLLKRGSSNFDFFNINHRYTSTPIISALYSNMILGDKTFSNEVVTLFNNLFLDQNYNNSDIQNELRPTNIKLNKINTTTTFDTESNAYRTWINLVLYNPTDRNFQEYTTQFELPEAVYVTDYYLYVFDEKKYGMLVDDRAAVQLYNRIVNSKKDPGLIRYIDENIIELKVFPFSEGEIRRTGFEIIHREPVKLTIDNKVVKIDCEPINYEMVFDVGEILTAQRKEHLSKATPRTPKYYFVLDSSKDSNLKENISLAKEYVEKNNIKDAQAVFTSYKIEQHPLENANKVRFKREGGFNLNLAVKNILNQDLENEFPIIVVVSNDILNSLLSKNIAKYYYKYPESLYYYSLNSDMKLTPYYYRSNKFAIGLYEVDTPVIENLLNYNGGFARDNGKTELVLVDTNYDNYVIKHENQYIAGSKLELMSRLSVQTNKDLVDIVKSSFKARVLTPYTAFMVVETKEQEEQLLKIQDNLLNNTNVEGQKLITTMNEPKIEILIIIVFIIYIFTKKKISQKKGDL